MPLPLNEIGHTGTIGSELVGIFVCLFCFAKDHTTDMSSSAPDPSYAQVTPSKPDRACVAHAKLNWAFNLLTTAQHVLTWFIVEYDTDSTTTPVMIGVFPPRTPSALLDLRTLLRNDCNIFSDGNTGIPFVVALSTTALTPSRMERVRDHLALSPGAFTPEHATMLDLSGQLADQLRIAAAESVRRSKTPVEGAAPVHRSETPVEGAAPSDLPSET